MYHVKVALKLHTNLPRGVRFESLFWCDIIQTRKWRCASHETVSYLNPYKLSSVIESKTTLAITIKDYSIKDINSLWVAIPL